MMARYPIYVHRTKPRNGRRLVAGRARERVRSLARTRARACVFVPVGTLAHESLAARF